MKWIFNSVIGDNRISHLVLLLFRVLLSLELMLVHGLKKVNNLDEELLLLPNPFNMNPNVNLWIAIIANLMMPLFVMAGLFTRLAVIPVLGITLTGYFIVHANDILAVKDIPFMYSLSFLMLLILGPGKFSTDEIIYRKLINKKFK